MSTYGWDASNWDDPPRVRDGIDLYTHKAAEGHHFYYDREYGASLNAARDLGIPVLGAYFVNHPGTVADQVDWFVQVLDQDTPWWRTHPCFVLQIDAEKFDYMDRAPTRAEIQAFGDRLVQVHGVKPQRVVAYAPQWLYGNTLAGLTYRLWASGYGTNPTVHYRQAYPGDASSRWQAYSGQTPLILQYGSNTTIGDQTTCDANAFRGTLEQLLAELGGNPDGGSDMAFMDDPDFAALAYRMHALINDLPAVVASIVEGEENKVHARLNELEAKVDAIEGGTVVLAEAQIKAAVRAELDKTKLAPSA